MIWKAIIYLLIAAVATGCGPHTQELPMLEQSDISLTWKGNIQVTYSSSGYQMGYNDATYEYRIYDDRLANWFSLRCDSKPNSPLTYHGPEGKVPNPSAASPSKSRRQTKTVSCGFGASPKK